MSEEDNRNNMVFRNKIDGIDSAPLIENIFDFLVLNFVELSSHLVCFYS